VTLKLAVSRSRPSVPYGANFFQVMENNFYCVTHWMQAQLSICSHKFVIALVDAAKTTKCIFQVFKTSSSAFTHELDVIFWVWLLHCMQARYMIMSNLPLCLPVCFTQSYRCQSGWTNCGCFSNERCSQWILRYVMRQLKSQKIFVLLHLYDLSSDFGLWHI